MEFMSIIFTALFGSIPDILFNAFRALYVVGVIVVIPFVVIMGLMIAWNLLKGVIILSLQAVFDLTVWTILKVLKLLLIILSLPKRGFMLMKKGSFWLIGKVKNDQESAKTFTSSITE